MPEIRRSDETLLQVIAIRGDVRYFHFADHSSVLGRITHVDTAGFFILDGNTSTIYNAAHIVRVTVMSNG